MSEKVFIPFSEALFNEHEAAPGELVPYQAAYRCVRLLDGTYDFQTPVDVDNAVKVELTQPGDLISRPHIGHAA